MYFKRFAIPGLIFCIALVCSYWVTPFWSGHSSDLTHVGGAEDCTHSDMDEYDCPETQPSCLETYIVLWDQPAEWKDWIADEIGNDCLGENCDPQYAVPLSVNQGSLMPEGDDCQIIIPGPS